MVIVPRTCDDEDDNDHRILHIKAGQRYILKDGDELPYKLLKNLGHGGCAIVEEVQDQWTGKVFARKVFKIRGSQANRKHIFENEVKIIQRLATHHHIIRVFATYVSKREVGLILSPVASRGALDGFLQDAHEGLLTESDTAILTGSFGCLANGLAFMHTQNVRHKDIKPHNILVHGNSLIYTDFGSSLDYSASTRSVTTGFPNSVTRRYAAPEVHDWSPRSSKTDVFSLGCVYLEILCALKICDIPADMTPYREYTLELGALLGSIENEGVWINAVTTTTQAMLNIDKEFRPSAKSLTTTLWKAQPSMFCEPCCLDLSAQIPILPVSPVSSSNPLLVSSRRLTHYSVAYPASTEVSAVFKHDQYGMTAALKLIY